MIRQTDRRLDQFLLRMPEGMRDRIAEVAKSNGRSMNAEIIAVLEAGLAKSRSKLAYERLLKSSPNDDPLEAIRADVVDLKKDIIDLKKHVARLKGKR